MEIQTVALLIITGIFAGVLSGFVGVGGGVIIVPALIYAVGMKHMEAQGTSLFILLLPVGILAVQQYHKQELINWKYGLIVALTFVVGGYFGSKLALRIPVYVVKIVFAVIMGYVAIKMMISGFNGWQENG